MCCAIDFMSIQESFELALVIHVLWFQVFFPLDVSFLLCGRMFFGKIFKFFLEKITHFLYFSPQGVLVWC